MEKLSCAITGHRIVERDFDEQKLLKLLKEMIEGGISTFYCGMALGFDSICLENLISLKKEKEIKIIACIPCVDQAEKFNSIQQEKYFYYLSKCDEKIILSNSYENGCMQKRNRYMVDKSDMLLAYLRYLKGGTLYTVKYAQKQGKKIIYI